VYNETARLANLYKISDFLKKFPYKTELIFVNDGSRDNTLPELKKMAKKLSFKIISYKQNKGKGYAVKTGMLGARGKYRLFTDIDLSVPIEELDNLIKMVEKFPVVIGSRRIKDSKILRHQPWLRESMGRLFTFLSQKILGLNVSDFTCGFKCFEKRAAKDIFTKVRIERWSFDSEIIFIARKLGYEIAELPVRWMHDSRTKVKFPIDVIRSLTELILIRYYNLRGDYK